MKKTVGIVATKARPCSQNSRARQYVQRVVHFVPALTAIAFSSSPAFPTLVCKICQVRFRNKFSGRSLRCAMRNPYLSFLGGNGWSVLWMDR